MTLHTRDITPDHRQQATWPETAGVHDMGMTFSDVSAPSARRLRNQNQRQYYVLYGITMTIFLVLAAICRVLPRELDPFAPAPGAPRSIFSAARNAACISVGYAFQH